MAWPGSCHTCVHLYWSLPSTSPAQHPDSYDIWGIMWEYEGWPKHSNLTSCLSFSPLNTKGAFFLHSALCCVDFTFQAGKKKTYRKVIINREIVSFELTSLVWFLFHVSVLQSTRTVFPSFCDHALKILLRILVKRHAWHILVLRPFLPSWWRMTIWWFPWLCMDRFVPIHWLVFFLTPTQKLFY